MWQQASKHGTRIADRYATLKFALINMKASERISRNDNFSAALVN
jgi:hypothetical protein